jgi:Concanavalin A-like lectin/glucanases superfamily
MSGWVRAAWLACGLLFPAGLGAAFALAASQAGADSPALALEWHLDGISGDGSTPDSSGNGLNGELVNPQIVSGRFGNAFFFGAEGPTTVVTRNPGARLEPSDNLSVVAWIKNGFSPGSYKYLVAKGARGCAAASYALYTGGSGGLGFYIDDGTQAHLSPEAGTGIWNGDWHAVAGTFDGQTVRLYLDGLEVGGGSPAASKIDYAAATSSNDLQLGSYPNGNCNIDVYYRGAMDEVRVYSRALTAGEIGELAKATGPDPPELTTPTTTPTQTSTPSTATTTTPQTTQTTPTQTTQTTPGQSPPPVRGLTARFVVATKEPVAGRLVVFDPSASRGAKGFAYDFDGSRKFLARCPASTPVAYKVFQTPGRRRVGLRVLGAGGDQASTSLTLNIGRAIAKTTAVTRKLTPGLAAIKNFWCGTEGKISAASSLYLPPLFTSEVDVVGIEASQGVVYDKPTPAFLTSIPLADAKLLRRATAGVPTAPRAKFVFVRNDEQDPADFRPRWLQMGGKTVVRVYATAAVAPFGVKVPNVQMRLYGFSNGQALPGSPLLSETGPLDIPLGPPFTTHAMRIGYDPTTGDIPAFTFTLPNSWTLGQLSLLAEPVLVGRRLDRQCTTFECGLRQNGRLPNLQFHNTGFFVIRSVAMTATGDPALASPSTEMDAAMNLTPVVVVASPYQATINIDSITKCVPLPKFPKICDDPNGQAMGLISQWATANEIPSSSFVKYLTIGLHKGYPAINGYSSWPSKCPENANGGALCETKDANPVSEVDLGRPLTSVGHELFHDLGRPHADGPSSGCGGNGEAKPDNRGHLLSIGLDRHPGSGGSLTRPYKLVSQDTAGAKNPYYDLMSYCANNNPDDDSWLSAYNWDVVAGEWLSYIRRLPASLVATANSGPGLEVRGFTDGSGTHITEIQPTSRGAVHAPADSPYRAVLRDAAGKVVGSAPLSVTYGHLDALKKGQPAIPAAVFHGRLPATGGQRLDITRSGTTMVTQRRSKHAPKLVLLAPRGGTIDHGKTVEVRWRAKDGDANRLTAYVDYSTNGGRNWRSVFVGPNRGNATLPSRYFTGSGDARVRIRVNDGFNESSAVSGRLRALGSPPAIMIESPGSGQKLGNDTSLYLRATAFDDAFTLLRGASLRWFVGKRLLGSGENVTATGLPPGRDVIRVLARDGRGRTASATVPVIVKAVRPFFLTLNAPARLTRTARSVSLRVATNVEATLKVSDQAFSVGRRPKTISVHITPGRGSLKLALRLSSHGNTASGSLLIPRR